MPFKIDQPFILIIFGASGDLAKLKLFPAIYKLMEQNRLPSEFHLIGYARTEKSDKDFKGEFEQSVKKAYGQKIDTKALEKLLKSIHYFQGQYDNLEDFKKLKEHGRKITKNREITKIAYFSVPPIAFEPILKNLGETKTRKDEDIRVVLEKPFGVDTISAKKLFHFAARYFDEEHTYLLDHYLGKGGVQSIMHLRHANRIFNLLLQGSEIANIQITSFETLGIENRVSYFDQVGVIKDMIQSHLLQILALLTMQIPVSKEARSIHREKYNILSSLTFDKTAKSISLGQYESYKKLDPCVKNSLTETFAAVRLFIDRESWHNVPIYLRSGKKLSKKQTYIMVEFKKFSFQDDKEEPNRLIIELQPDEKIIFKFLNKQRILAEYDEITTSESIAYRGEDPLPEHGILLLDIIRKRKIRFLNFNEIIASWEITDKIIKHIKSNELKPNIYKEGSNGPNSQHKITLPDGFTWYDN